MILNVIFALRIRRDEISPAARGGPPERLGAVIPAFLPDRAGRRCGPRGPWIARVRPLPRRGRGTPRKERTAIAGGALAHGDAIAWSDQRTGPARHRAGPRRAGPPSACGYRRPRRTPARRRGMPGRPGTPRGAPP